jgi:lipopolysaccharide transport system permease protein
VPYFLFVFAAMVPWQFFSNALSEASNSLIGNSNLISKIYFPRMIVPASSIVTSLVDLGISLIILIALFFVYQYVPDIKIILLPFFTLLALVTVLGVGLYITALNVKYRDFRYVIPFIIQLGLYITPVGFSSQVVPVQYRLWYSINPMVGVIDGFRWCLFNTPLYLPGLMASIVVSIGFLVLGIRYFRSTERGFADII